MAADATSIAAGKQLYDKQCAGCHGDTGKGDGSMGEELNPKPANLSDADWTYLLKLNLDTTFRVFRECARRFERARGGVLVAVSAPAALLGEAGVGGYAATKAGVLRMVESLAREMAPFGGRANAVLPGTMDTPANRAAMPDSDPSQWAKTDDVASVIHFLTTPAAVAVNGAAVRVPGPHL